MDMFGHVKNVVRELIDIGLVLIALAIVVTILVGGAGGTLPFFGNVVANLTSLVKDLGSNGLVGLIVLGVILWLFSSRSGTATARK
jgi:ABC-type enterochelin transport system permease subunit